MLALAALLAATSQAYGYHRDELYFRMLDPAWGYIDQPPLTPLIARTLASIIDEPWFLRLPAVLAAVAAVFVAALIAREVGGARRAQALAAWTAAAAAFPMIFGHVLVTSSIDLVVWPLVCLFAIRALLRSDGRWWLAVGLVAGLASYNKLLIAVLLIGLGVGLLVFGPWRALRSPWLWGGILIAIVLALPNIVYQVSHGWPQFAMSAALAENDGGETRWLMWPMLLLLVGPLLVPIWVAGIVTLLRRRSWRDIRLLVGAFVVVLVFTFVGSAQFYYPLGVVQVLLAIGCVPTAEWMRTRARRALVWTAVALNSAISAVIALPLVPIDVVGATPLPAMNQVTADSIGWPAIRATDSGCRGLGARRTDHHRQLRRGRRRRPLRAGARPRRRLQRTERALAPRTPAGCRRRRRVRGLQPAVPRAAVRVLRGARRARQRAGRRQRGAGRADHRLHRHAHAVERGVAAVRAPRLRRGAAPR